MARSILAIAAGLILALFIIFSVESLAHYLYPLPPGVSMDDSALLREAMYNAPVEMYLLVLIGYMAASFAGGLVAAFLSRQHRLRNALVVGLVLMAAGIANMLMVPHAPWFWLSVLVYLPLAYLGGRIGNRSLREPMNATEEKIV